MKKILVALILWLAFTAQADELQGVRANVELVTGAKQTAQFLGIQQDTVSLGGIIQGKFTVLKIAKNRFKSIVDEAGNDLLNATVVDSSAVSIAASDSAAIDSASVDSVDTIIADSATAESPNSPSADSTPAFLHTVDGKHILVALERRSIDSLLASQMNNLIAKLLQESGIPVVTAKRTDFGYCRESNCIRDSLSHYGAASIFNGKIVASKSPDSVLIQMYHQDFSDTTQKKNIIELQMNLSVISALTDALTNDKLKNFVTKLTGKELQDTRKKISYIHVETDPEGVTLATESQGEICRTPCTFATPDTGKVVLYAYWSVNKQMWGARHAIVPVPFDTTKISLKLKRVRPELSITTIPGDAEIFAGSAPVTLSSSPIGYTPNKFSIYEPGETTIQLRKAGFRDTSITLFVPPTDLTNLDVELTPISSAEEKSIQNDWLKNRKKRKIGHTLMGSAIAPLLAGGLFMFLASDDYDEAKKIKQNLNRPATAGGASYQEQLDKNHELVDSGKRKNVVGGTLLGIGALMLGFGFAISF